MFQDLISFISLRDDVTTICWKHLTNLKTWNKRNHTKAPSDKLSPVVRAPVGVLGFQDVEGVHMARVFWGVFSAAMHNFTMDQDYATWTERWMEVGNVQQPTNSHSFIWQYSTDAGFIIFSL